MIKFLQDDNGNNSSMRLAMLVVVAAIMIGWLYVVLTTKSLPDIPAGVLGIFSAVVAGKVWQKYPESK